MIAGLTKCETQRVDFSSNAVPGAFVPRCKQNGNFEAEQCHGSVCYCVNRNGIRIPHSAVSIGKGMPQCRDLGKLDSVITDPDELLLAKFLLISTYLH